MFTYANYIPEIGNPRNRKK